MKLALLAALTFSPVMGQITRITPSTGATTSYASTALQSAVDAAACGDIIEIDPASGAPTTTGIVWRGPNSSVAPKSCSDWPGITVRTSKHYNLPAPDVRIATSDEPNMAKITSTTSGYTIIASTEPGARFYHFRGLIFEARAELTYNIIYLGQVLNGSEANSSIDIQPHHIFFSQCWIRGVGGASAKKAIVANGAQIWYDNGLMTYIRADDGDESQGVNITGGSGPLFIRNSEIQAKHINFLAGGAAPSMPGLTPQWIVVENNLMRKPFKWFSFSGTADPTGTCPYDPESDWGEAAGNGALYQNTATPSYWQCLSGTWTSIPQATYTTLVTNRKPGRDKNVFEFKHVRNGIVRGNKFANSWGHNDLNQRGNCILLNLVDYDGGNATLGAWARIENVRIEDNLCENTASGIGMGTLQFDATGYTPGNPTIITMKAARRLQSGQSYNIRIGNCITQDDYVVTVLNDTQVSIPVLSTSGCSVPRFYNALWNRANIGIGPNVDIRNNIFSIGEDKYTWPSFSNSTFLGTSSIIQLGGYYQHGISFTRNSAWQYVTNGTNRTAVTMDNCSDAGVHPSILYPVGVIVADNVMNDSNSGWIDTNCSGGNLGNSQINTMGKYPAVANNFIVDSASRGVSAFNSNHLNHCDPTRLDCPYTTAFNSLKENNCSGCKRIADTTTAAFANFSTRDYTATSSSPFYRRASTGHDAGADVSRVTAATSGVVAGTFSPYLRMHLRVIPSQTSATVYLAAPDGTTSCTAEARVKGFPYSAAVATVTPATDGISRSGNLTGLTANTQYGILLTCGSYARETEVRTAP